MLSQDTKKGLASAYLAGFQWGLVRDYDFFMQMDGDLSHQPEQIPQLLALSSTKNLVIGTRWMAGGQVVNWPKRRRYISKFGTRYAAFILKLPFKDLTSGYRVLPKQLLERLDLNRIETQGYSFQIEIIMKAVNLGFDIKQVPITFIERANGKLIDKTIDSNKKFLRDFSWVLASSKNINNSTKGVLLTNQSL